MAFEHKVSLIGPVPVDHITTWKNETFKRYGCLTYPSIALSRLFGKLARITPITHVRKQDLQAIKTILRGHRGIELLRINADYDRGDVIQLQFINKYKCIEKQYGFMNPIIPDDVKHVLDSDFFLVLPVTDYDITLETMQFIKEYSNSVVIFDAHGATKTMTSLGDRVSKFWVDRDLWLPYIDVLVMTMEQAKYIWFNKEYTLEQLEDIEDLSAAALCNFADHCFAMGIKAVYVNVADKGCWLHYKKDGKLQQHMVAAVPTGDIIDITGWSESFIAGLTYGLAKYNDYIKAAQFGSVVSSQRTRGAHYEVFDTVADTIKAVQELYG